MTHLEGNKIIAEFVVPDWRSEFDSGDIDVDTDLLVKMALGLNQLEMLKYHSSWNALMPVVEKIENLDAGRGVFLVRIEGYFCSISIHDETEWLICESDLATSKIDAVWQTVIKFIKLTKNV